MRTTLLFAALLILYNSKGQAWRAEKGPLFDQKRQVTAVDSNESYVWIGTDAGIYRLDRNRKHLRYFALPAMTHRSSRVNGVLCQENGFVWIATNHGLMKYDNFYFVVFTMENSDLPEENITSICAINGNAILIGTAQNGYLRMKRNRMYPCKDELPATMIIAKEGHDPD
jgi:hypothetical protein